MKYLSIFLAIILTVSIFAQEDSRSNPNVELPDFVITGSDDISIQKAQKIRPEYISTVSPDFLKPVFSPEELEMRDLSNPIKSEIDIFDTLDYYTGNLEAGAGSYTIPRASFSYAHTFQAGGIEAYINAINKRAHVDFSDHFGIDGGINFIYQIEREAAFLPGSNLKLHGDYGVSAYRFYASESDPSLKRTHNSGLFSAEINNQMFRNFSYGLKVNNEISSFSDENYSENLFGLDLSGRYNFTTFNVGMLLNFKQQSLENNLVGDASFDFIKIRPTIGLNISETLKAIFGISYAKAGDEKNFSPYAALGLKVDDKISFFAEYNAEPDFFGTNYFINKNPYLNPQIFTNLFFEKALMHAAVKYEYFRYFEINGGVKYISADYFPYFQPSVLEGRFDLLTVDARTIEGYLNLIFHLGPYGIFYGTAELSDTRDTGKNILPYMPETKASLAYGYDFGAGISTRAELHYTSGVFTNIQNTESLDDFIDVRLKLAYNFSKGFNLFVELNNLFSSDNYIWRGYKETPLDVVAGFNLKW